MSTLDTGVRERRRSSDGFSPSRVALRVGKTEAFCTHPIVGDSSNSPPNAACRFGMETAEFQLDSTSTPHESRHRLEMTPHRAYPRIHSRAEHGNGCLRSRQTTLGCACVPRSNGNKTSTTSAMGEYLTSATCSARLAPPRRPLDAPVINLPRRSTSIQANTCDRKRCTSQRYSHENRISRPHMAAKDCR